ncbi:Uncharacterized protein LW93_9889 [Fusarium fujikuroi]|nr:Uncharacterized protein LW93_9889 [Fusarium fujikuroi]
MIAEISESITRAELDLSSPIKHFVPQVVILSTTITSNTMAEPETPRTPAASDDDSYEGSDVSDEPKEPRLTPDELRALFIDFYTFLTTFYYDKSCLKVPRRLDGQNSLQRRGDMLDAVPVGHFFDRLKEQYETLKLITGRCRITIEAEKVPEHGGRITKEEVTEQTEGWETDLDVQYVRQIYRDHGWPGSSDMETASEAIDEWLEPFGGGEGQRGLTWQRSPSDWDETRWT